MGVAIAEINHEKPFSNELLSSLFKEVLIFLIRDFKKISPDKQLDTVLSAEVICYKLMNYIDTHIYSIKNLQELSDVTGYSYGYLSSLFKKTTSQSLCQYYTQKKADAARLLLLENRFTITEISDLLGFASVYSFSKAFSKHFGRPPRAYRKENQM